MPAVLYLPFPYPGARLLQFCLPESAHLHEDGTVSTPAASISVTAMPQDEVGPHLQGLLGWLDRSGASRAARIRAMHSVAALSVGSEAEAHDPAFRELVERMLIATDGLLFDGGHLITRTGESLGVGLARPTADGVARRALVLLAVSSRGLLEQSANTEEQSDAEALRGQIRDWLHARGVTDACEPEEADLLGRSVGGLEPQETLDAVWRAEGAQVLLWALGARALPAHDAQEHPYQVSAEIGLAREGSCPILEGATLLDESDIDAMQLRLQGIHWRFRQQQFQPGPMDFEAFASRPPMGPFSLDGVALSGADLALDGAPIDAADGSRLGLCTSIARERHTAANWLLGVNPLYGHVQAPT